MVYDAVSNAGGTFRSVSLRTAKSTSSIVAKLQRESTRLSQIQDIAGCRIVVPTIAAQIYISEEGLDFEAAGFRHRDQELAIGYQLDPTVGIAFTKRADIVEDLSIKDVGLPRFRALSSDSAVSVREIDRIFAPHFGYRALHYVVMPGQS
ncbi:MAG: hypothetical protein NVSMB21_10350 [Vulcanimicrobiaceae bacterium]